MTDQDPTQRYEAPPIDNLPPEEAPAPTSQVAATAEGAPGSRPGRSPLRWLVALVVTILVVGMAAGATVLLTAAAGDPDVLAWAPADSVAYAELRLDLPGDQRDELAKVMSAFPGFDDQAAFDTKLDEALDQLVRRASDGKVGYQADIAPWFNGQLSVSMGPVPTEATSARALLLLGVSDADQASAWAQSLLTDSGASTETQVYEGETITTVSPLADVLPGEAMSLTAAYAVSGPVLAVGDLVSVKAAIDTKGAGGLSDNQRFQDAVASVSGDRLGFAYLDTAAFLEAAQAARGGGDGSGMELPSLITDLQAPWVAMALRADGDAFVVEARQPHVAALGPAGAGESKIAALVPPTTVLLATGHDVGAGLLRLRDLAAEEPSLSDGLEQIEGTLSLLGGLDGIVGWIGDVGVAITRDGDALGGGVVVTPSDPAAADRLLTQLRGFLSLAGGSAGLSVTDESYGDATITTITIENVAGLIGTASPEVPKTVDIAYAATDDVVAIGYGSDFVKAVLDARGGESLATQDRFSSLLDRAGREHGSLFWLDVASIRGLVEGMIPDEKRADYETDTRPYLEAFDALMATNVPGDDIDRGTLIVRVAGK